MRYCMRQSRVKPCVGLCLSLPGCCVSAGAEPVAGFSLTWKKPFFRGRSHQSSPALELLDKHSPMGLIPVTALASRSVSAQPSNASVTTRCPNYSRAITVFYLCVVSQLFPVFKNNVSQIVRPRALSSVEFALGFSRQISEREQESCAPTLSCRRKLTGSRRCHARDRGSSEQAFPPFRNRAMNPAEVTAGESSAPERAARRGARWGTARIPSARIPNGGDPEVCKQTAAGNYHLQTSLGTTKKSCVLCQTDILLPRKCHLLDPARGETQGRETSPEKITLEKLWYFYSLKKPPPHRTMG